MKEEKDNIQKIVDSVKKDDSQKERDPIFFFVGAILLIIGIFILSRKVIVSTWIASFNVLGYNLTSGLLIFPLIFGIIWMFYNPKSLGAKILSGTGAIFLIVAVIMSVHIHLSSMSLFDYILIIGMIAAGSGMLLRYFFKHK